MSDPREALARPRQPEPAPAPRPDRGAAVRRRRWAPGGDPAGREPAGAGPQPAAGQQAPHPAPEPQPARSGAEQQPAEDGGDAAAEPEGADRTTWFGGMLGGAREAAQNAATNAAGNFGGRAGDWAADRVFGSAEEPAPLLAGVVGSAQEGLRPTTADQPDGLDGLDDGVTARPGSGAEGWSTLPAYVQPGSGGLPGAVTGGRGAQPGYVPSGVGPAADAGSEAYAWARAQVREQMQQLEEAQHKSRGGLSGALDDLVVQALEASGLLDMLEKVTGKLDELNGATMEWQAQASAVRAVAAELRSGVVPVAESWSGSASDAFGGHMGEVADALDQTAEEMMQTARIINSAAQECATAEGMVIDIITEAIESLIVSLAAEAVLSVVTFGAAALVGALIDEAEIGVFVARVARVSTKLAKALEELLKALQEMGRAVKATRKLGDIAKVMERMKKVESSFNKLRELGEGESRIADLANKAVQKGVEKGTQKAESWSQGQVEDWMGMDGGDRDGVQVGDGTLKGNLKAAGQTAVGVAKDAWHSDANQDAIKGEFLNDVGPDQEPAPYRVDRSRIQTAFG
ncbi:WXG100 family type VII secretion target [Kitasatospora sp. NA04385]|uniref:WXG100 family type VII secretion target n=1 Tax=Kitasatospora sp. NA04385 TaxID=2742135 RepID=UPI0015902AD0|nr:WXG100 family type VII secretion target [Kitasatospora sp. NA04385]QKW19150.1 WXG100 family type VII secretion target [Kitasatospora sp. NA04385]